MIGYIARDADGLLFLHDTKPEYEDLTMGYYSGCFFQISDDIFPEFKNITCKDGPIKVEIKLERVDRR